MEQTAVEWLFKQMPIKIQIQYKTAYEQAKAMEKEQIMDAYGVVLTTEQGDIMNAEQYYNETFKSE